VAGHAPPRRSPGPFPRTAFRRPAAAGQPGPWLVLLDEPFSALDAPVRDELRRELRRLQQETGLSTVLVTHDPEEAALLADEILVIADGRLLQAGPRSEVYNRPASPEVARLLGIQNLTPGVVAGPGEIMAGAVRIRAGTGELPAGSDILWCIRPDHITLGEHGEHGEYEAVITDLADIGTLVTLTVQLAGGPDLRIRTADAARLSPGDTCWLGLDPDSITLWLASPQAAPQANMGHT
jgi:molybdate transport system permease protein